MHSFPRLYEISPRILTTTIFSTSAEEEVAFGPKNLEAGPEETAMRVGQPRKVALASIAAMKPEVMILGEPTTGILWNGQTFRVSNLVSRSFLMDS